MGDFGGLKRKFVKINKLRGPRQNELPKEVCRGDRGAGRNYYLRLFLQKKGEGGNRRGQKARLSLKKVECGGGGGVVWWGGGLFT